jgi:uncharacterized Zn-binding protein involved in type VI secretion
MPAACRLGDKSTGHGCFPPTAVNGAVASKTTIEGPAAATIDSTHPPHSCGKTVHSGRKISSGASKTTIEGKKAARIGDSINCGDAMGQGASKTFIS